MVNEYTQVKAYRAGLEKALNALQRNRGAELKVTDGMDAATATNIIYTLRDVISCVVKGVSIDGMQITKFATSVSPVAVDGKLYRVDLTVRNSKALNIPHVEEKVTIDNGNDVFAKMCECYVKALTMICKCLLAAENVRRLNAKLRDIYDSSDVPVGFAFQLVLDDTYIVDMDDELIIYGVNPDRGLGISNLPIFFGGTDWADNCSNTVQRSIVEACQAAGNTPHLLKMPVSMVHSLTGVRSKKRADTLIRRTVHKNAKYLSGKGGIGYFSSDVEIDGTSAKVFALIEQEPDGTKTVRLSPFDIHTLFTVNYDVLGHLSESQDCD